MHRSFVFPFLLACSLSFAACTAVRQTKPLAYAGEDPRSAVVSLEASIKKRGYKPICEEDAYCKFQYGSSVWIHYKTSAKKVVMAVDVVDGKEMAADKRKALADEAAAIGEEIWREASLNAQQREKASAEQARIDAEKKKKAEEEREAAAKKNAEVSNASGGGGLTGVLNAASGVLDGINKAQGSASSTSASTTRCVNHAFYNCKTPSSLNKCAGEFSSCMTKCMMGSDMTCGDRCLKEHPPDPSGCDRMPERDGECASSK
jgi:hypothetical protein